MLAAMLPVLAAQSAPAPLAPHGKWVVDFGDLCTLMRSYGPDGGLTLGLRPVTGGSIILLVMYGGAGTKLRVGKARVTLGDTVVGDIGYFTTSDPRTNQSVTVIRTTRDRLAGLGGATTIRIKTGEQPEQAFLIPSADKSLAVLASCENDLLKSWGVDADAIAQPVDAGEWMTWYSYDDYPASALSGGEQGTVTFRVTVDASGHPSDCVIIGSSESTALDQTTCQVVLRRGRFKPARDKSGKPVPSIWSSSVIWRLP